MKNLKKRMTVQQLAKMGGDATRRKYAGTDFYKKLSRKGVLARRRGSSA